LGNNKKNGIDQCTIGRIQEELGYTFPQISGRSSWYNKALHQIVTCPKEQLRHLPNHGFEGIAEKPKTKHDNG
jgi:hypothetical protein